MNDMYQPINCGDCDDLELTCQHHLVLTLELKGDEKLQAEANDLVSRRNVEYLVVEAASEARKPRLDRIISFSHPEISTMVVSGSWLAFARCDV